MRLMKKTIPLCRYDRLSALGYPAAITVGSETWFDWLKDARSFRYESETGSFSAVKEEKKSGWYWTGHRRIKGSLRRHYLGASPDLTLSRLEQAARELADPLYWEKRSPTLNRIQSQETSSETDKNSLNSLAHISETEDDSNLDDPSKPNDVNVIRSQSEKIQVLQTHLRLLQREVDEARLQREASEKLASDYYCQMNETLKRVDLWREKADERDRFFPAMEQEIKNLKEQLDDMATKAGEWYNRAKAAETELAEVRVNPEVIALLQEAIKLKANAGGAIKRKIEQALALLSNSQ